MKIRIKTTDFNVYGTLSQGLLSLLAFSEILNLWYSSIIAGLIWVNPISTLAKRSILPLSIAIEVKQMANLRTTEVIDLPQSFVPLLVFVMVYPVRTK